MARHKRPHAHAVRTSGVGSSRWEHGESKHRIQQPNAAERTKFIIALESNPAKFRELVGQWKSRNEGGTLELGDAEFYTTIADMDFTRYSPQDLKGVKFSRVTFKNARFASRDQVAAFDDCDAYYSGVVLGDETPVRKARPAVVEEAAPVVTPQRPAAFAGEARPTTVQAAGVNSRQAVGGQVAGLNAMLRATALGK